MRICCSAAGKSFPPLFSIWKAEAFRIELVFTSTDETNSYKHAGQSQISGQDPQSVLHTPTPPPGSTHCVRHNSHHQNGLNSLFLFFFFLFLKDNTFRQL